MANYPLHSTNKEGTLLYAQSSFYSDEYAERMCDLHLRDEVHKDDRGNYHKYYTFPLKRSIAKTLFG